MIDFHVHFFPEHVFRAIWRFFEGKGSGLWTVQNRLFGRNLVEYLRKAGVKRFTTLVYAHRSGLADELNDYVESNRVLFPEIIPFGTVYAGDNPLYCARRIFEEYDFTGIKLHPFVSKEEIDDSRLFPVYELMESKGKILVCHPGSGPVYESTDGAKRLDRILRQFPNLRVVVAHCGAFEYGDYPILADTYEHVYFDTAMNCVHVTPFANNCPGREFFLRYSRRVLFGTDFPNVPYEYSVQVQALKVFQLGPEIEQMIFQDNARRLLAEI